MDYPTVKLNPGERSFLAKYCPEDKMFTTVNETSRIVNSLNLNSRKSFRDIQALRNTVVEYLATRMEQESDETQVNEHWMPALQSITAVIDDVIRKRFGSFS